MTHSRTKLLLASIAVAVIFVFNGRVGADTELKFEKASFLENKGEQIGNAIDVRDSRIYVAGIDTYSGSKSLLASYAPLVDVPLWSLRWSDEKGPLPFTSVVFNDVTATDEGLYFAGYGLSESKGKKYSTSLLVKFPLDPSAGPKAGTPIWVQRPEFFPAFKQEAFHAVIAVKELGSIFIYVTGYVSTGDSNSTALLAKYDANGRLVWSKMLSDTGAFKKSAGTALAVLNNFIYVSGSFGSGKKKDEFEDYPLNAKLWKYDFSGQPVFEREVETKLYPSKSSRGEMKMDMAASGNHLYLVGSQKAAKGKGGDGVLLKYDEFGALIWEMKRGTDSESGSPWYGLVKGIAAGSDRLYVVGRTEDVEKEQSKKNEDAFLLEVDKEYGTVLATHLYGDAKNNEAALGVQVVGTDVYVVGIRKASNNGNSDLMLLRYSPLPVVEVKIDIQPGDSENAIVREDKNKKEDEKAKKDEKQSRISVAVFSTSKLNLLSEIEHRSLTFGRTGNESSWESSSFKDLNQDGLVDYLCHFKTLWRAGKDWHETFRLGDTEGILKGQTNSGKRLRGKDIVRIKASGPVASEPVAPAPAPAPAPTTLVSQTPQPATTEPAPTAVTTTTSTPTTTTSTSTAPTTTTSPTTTTLMSSSPTPVVTTTSTSTMPTATTSTTQTQTSEPVATIASPTTTTTTMTTSTEPVLSPTTTLTATPTTTTSSTQTQTTSPTTTTTTTTFTEPAPMLATTSTSTSTLTTAAEPTAALTTTSSPLLTTTTKEPILEPTLSTATMTPTAVMEPMLMTSTTSPSSSPTTSTTQTPTSTTTISSTSLQPYTTTTTELSKTTLEAQLAMTSTQTTAYVPPTGTSYPIPPQTAPALTTSMTHPTLQDSIYKSGASRSENDLPFWLRTLISKNRERVEEKAEGQLEDEAEKEPNSDMGLILKYNDKAREAFNKGKFSEAINYYTEALKLDPRSPELHHNLGLVLFKEGKLDEAAAHFSEALKLNPDDTSARQNLDIVLAKQKELKKPSNPTPAT